jgi:hypothetical protein
MTIELLQHRLDKLKFNASTLSDPERRSTLLESTDYLQQSLNSLIKCPAIDDDRYTVSRALAAHIETCEYQIVVARHGATSKEARRALDKSLHQAELDYEFDQDHDC